MKKVRIHIVNFLSVILIFCFTDVSAQFDYAYTGYLKTANGKKPDVFLGYNLMMDSIIYGDFYIDPCQPPLAFFGILHSDNTFYAGIVDINDSTIGQFNGMFYNQRKEVSAILTCMNNEHYGLEAVIPQFGFTYAGYAAGKTVNGWFTDTDSATRYPQSAKILDLKGKNLDKLPAGVRRLKNLESMDLGNNDFTKIPKITGKLKSLKNLSLANNKLNIQEKDLDLIAGIRVLTLSGNNLKSIPMNIGILQSLVYLDLSNNHLVSIPQSAEKLLNLRYLILTGNPVSEHEKTRIRQLLPWCVVKF